MSELLSPTLSIKQIVKSPRDLHVLTRHGYNCLSQIRDSDRAHFEDWGIEDIDFLLAAAREARTPKGG